MSTGGDVIKGIGLGTELLDVLIRWLGPSAVRKRVDAWEAAEAAADAAEAAAARDPKFDKG